MVVELLTRMRHAPDRLMHAHRRRYARRVVTGLSSARQVLVICHGNICRSPFAEAVLRAALAPWGVRIVSRGLMGEGRPSPDAAVRVAARRGVDLAAHRSRNVTLRDVQACDIAVVMDAEQAWRLTVMTPNPPRVVLLGDFDPLTPETRAIRDPIDTPDATFDAVYARIERCARTFARALLARGSGVGLR